MSLWLFYMNIFTFYFKKVTLNWCLQIAIMMIQGFKQRNIHRTYEEEIPVKEGTAGRHSHSSCVLQFHIVRCPFSRMRILWNYGGICIIFPSFCDITFVLNVFNRNCICVVDFGWLGIASSSLNQFRPFTATSISQGPIDTNLQDLLLFNLKHVSS